MNIIFDTYVNLVFEKLMSDHQFSSNKAKLLCRSKINDLEQGFYNSINVDQMVANLVDKTVVRY